MRITSLNNQRIKNVAKLHQRKHRDRQRALLIEGYRALWWACERAHPLHALYICPELFYGKNEQALIGRVRQNGVPVIETSEAIFRKIGFRARPDGLLAVAPQRHRSLHEHRPTANAFYLIAEAIEKPGNLGTLLRAADGAGASGLLLCNRGTDIFHPDVVHGSTGAFFNVPVFTCTSGEALAWCQQHRIRTVAATPDAPTLYTDADLRGSVAIAVGTEQYGLSDLWLRESDRRVRLPMLGQVDSLNVAIAAAILAYEVVRQRQETELEHTDADAFAARTGAYP